MGTTCPAGCGPRGSCATTPPRSRRRTWRSTAPADGSEYRGYAGVSAEQLEAFHGPRLEVLAAAGADVVAVETLPSAVEARVVAGLLGGHPAARAWISFACRDGRSLVDGTPFE